MAVRSWRPDGARVIDRLVYRARFYRRAQTIEIFECRGTMRIGEIVQWIPFGLSAARKTPFTISVYFPSSERLTNPGRENVINEKNRREKKNWKQKCRCYYIRRRRGGSVRTRYTEWPRDARVMPGRASTLYGAPYIFVLFRVYGR